MRIVLWGLALALGACTSTYHPEYHPVSVTEVVTPASGVVIQQQPIEPYAILR
jgi:hypothetical protein